MNHELLIEWDTVYLSRLEEYSFPTRDSITKILEESILTTLQEEQLQLPCEISVYLTDNEGIQAINKEHRDKDTATDVLSFPMFELQAGIPPNNPEYLDPETKLLPLGDMVLSLDRAKAQGEEFGHGFEQEVRYLVLHSVLHLLGYDHLDEGEQKKQMRQREKEILPLLPKGENNT